VAAPAFTLPGTQRTLTGILMFAVLAQAWNVIGGFAGYPNFGHVAFFGVGAYVVAVLMAKAGWTFWPALAAAGIAAVGYAVVVGTPALRLRGHYFAVAMLGVAEGTREIVIHLPGITGGGAGITIPAVGPLATQAYPGNTGFYYDFLALLLLATAAVWAVGRTRFGYALRAIHQDEEAAAAAGINTTRMKVAALALSGLLASLAGGVFALQQVTIFPDRPFSVEITVLAVVMAVLGGTGTTFGPLLGAGTLQLLSEYLRRNYLELHALVFGAIVILGVVLLPQGAVSFLRDARRSGRWSLLDNVRRYRL
jgi:branched-chain amino acid transport system permease protein